MAEQMASNPALQVSRHMSCAHVAVGEFWLLPHRHLNACCLELLRINERFVMQGIIPGCRDEGRRQSRVVGLKKWNDVFVAPLAAAFRAEDGFPVEDHLLARETGRIGIAPIGWRVEVKPEHRIDQNLTLELRQSLVTQIKSDGSTHLPARAVAGSDN